MSLNTLLLAAALNTVDAKEPLTPAVEPAELMTHCRVTAGSPVTRRQVETLTAAFAAGFEEAMTEPSERALRRAFAMALATALQDQVTNPEKLKARLLALDKTLDDPVGQQSFVAPNREEIRDARQASAEEEVLLNFVFEVDGRPYNIKDLLRKYPQFEALYKLAAAEAFASGFKDAHGVDCIAGVQYAVLVGDGNFPSVNTVLSGREPTQVVLTAERPAMPALAEVPPSADWRMGLGLEQVEREAAEAALEAEALRVTKGFDILARRYDLDGYTGPVVAVRFQFKDPLVEETEEEPVPDGAEEAEPTDESSAE